MSVEQNKDVVRQFCDQFSRGDVAAMEEQLAEDFVDHHPMNTRGNRAGARETWQSLVAAIPDLTVEPEELVAEGDKVVGRFSISGTQRGEFLGIPPSDNSFHIYAMDMMRIRDGKIAEYWGNPDRLSLLQQLGAMPE